MEYRLSIPYEDFTEAIEDIICFAENLIEHGMQEVEIKSILSSVNEKVFDVLNYIKPQSDVLTNLYYDSVDYRYKHFRWLNQDLDFTLEEKSDVDFAKVVLRGKVNSLEYILDYASLSERFLKPESDVLCETVTDKKDFLLNKLLKVFNDRFYSIEKIFALNDINYRVKEGEELAEDLAKRGYVIREDNYNGDKVKLSIKGASYAERKAKSKNVKTSKAKTSKAAGKSDLNKKLDEISERLRKLGYGQEIIFNEIEELRDLQMSLSKKTWTQVLKGKLIDMSIEKVISKEAAFMVYEFLTNDHLKLM